MSEAPQRSKIAAGILAIFPLTGALGVHRFYLGQKGLGFAHLGLLLFGLVTLVIFVGAFFIIGNIIWSVIEGVMILVGAINKDGDGQPLVG